MASNTLPVESVKRLRLNHIRAYAEQRGWRRGEVFRGALAIFNRAGALDQLLVPTNPDFDDFAEQMGGVVERLARGEGRSPSSVLTDIFSLDTDTLRFSVRSPLAAQGTLPLEQGLSLLDGAKRSLLAAACTAISPQQAYHPRMSRSEAEDFVRNCELGQTEVGSYTVTVRCPMLGLDGAAEAPDAEIPFARKATEILAASVAKIARAIDEDHAESLLEPAAEGDVQITANLCDALVEMQPERENSSLAFSVNWASTRPSRATAAPVVIRNEHFQVISNTGRLLRGRQMPQAALFVAQVDELRGALDEMGDRNGEVRLTLLYEDEAIKARGMLNTEQYALADRAHMAGQAIVLRAVLNRGPRVSNLTEIQQFEILSQGN